MKKNNKSILHIVDSMTIYEEIEEKYVSFSTDLILKDSALHKKILKVIRSHQTEDDLEFQDFLRNHNANEAKL